MTDLLETQPADAGIVPPTTTATATAEAPAPGTGWSAEAITLIALVASVAVGETLFFRASAAVPLGAIAGLMAGLGCRRWWSACAVAALGAVGGSHLAVAVGKLALVDAGAWLPGVVQGATIAAVVAAAVAWLVRSRPTLRVAVEVAAVVAICSAMWFAAITLATVPGSNGVSSADLMQQVPQFTASTSDEGVYLIWIARLRAGEPYYPMAAKSFAEAQQVLGANSLVRVRSPFSYRPPTLYYLLAALPPNGISFVIAIMVLATLGVAASYALARQFASPAPSMASAVFVAGMFSGFGSIQLLHAEAWAGMLAIVCVSAFVLSRTRPDHERAFQIAAVISALAATSFREIALPLLVLGLLACLASADLRAKKAWRLWAAGLAVAVVALAAHWAAAAAAFAPMAEHGVASTWFHPTGAGLVGAMFLLYALMSLSFIAVALLLVLGMAASIAAPQDWPTRIMLAGVAVGGPVLLFFFHPPGYTGSGAAPGYWGLIVWPTVLTCAPLAFVRLTRRRTKRSHASGGTVSA